MTFLTNELARWQQEGLVESSAHEAILAHYRVKSLSFVKVVLTIGALLVGLGVLSFIASNWADMGKAAKLLVIVGLYAGAAGAGFSVSVRFPKTGRSLVYLSGLIYGAGIFLIGQMFHLGGNFNQAFLLWSLGLLPMTWLLRDTILYIFAQLLMLVFIMSGIENPGWDMMILMVIPGVYLMNRFMEDNRAGTFFNNLVLFGGVGYLLTKLEVSGLIAAGIYLVLGALLYSLPLPFNRDIFKFQGAVCFGISGLFITGKNLWSHYAVFGDGVAVSIVFAVLFGLLLLAYVRNGSLVALVFVCATILRFYFDTFFDFMPKSFFFIIGGLILLGFGFYFERLRARKGEPTND